MYRARAVVKCLNIRIHLLLSFLHDDAFETTGSSNTSQNVRDFLLVYAGEICSPGEKSGRARFGGALAARMIRVF